jgi:hypothetical protein
MGWTRAPEASAGPVPAARTEIAPAGWVAIGAGAVVVIGLVVALVVRIRRRQA